MFPSWPGLAWLGHKIKQIGNIEFEEADGGREVGYFCVVVTVSVVQVC